MYKTITNIILAALLAVLPAASFALDEVEVAKIQAQNKTMFKVLKVTSNTGYVATYFPEEHGWGIRTFNYDKTPAEVCDLLRGAGVDVIYVGDTTIGDTVTKSPDVMCK